MTMPQQRIDSRPRATPGAALVAVDGRIYPLRSAAITARAEGGLALTTLTQEFANPHREPLEVIYTLPLPADGAVLGYAIHIGERVFRGEVEKRMVANETYVRALSEGRTAGLLEQDRDDSFSQRLGSLPPGQDVRVEIEVLHPLDFVPAAGPEAARWEFRFPTVVGVRYEGGPGRVPDAGRLDVDRAGEGEIPTRMELDLTVADGSPEAIAVVSTTHDIRCAAEAGVTRVGLRAGARLDRDLVVRWNACADRIGVRLVEGPGRPGDDGRYALLTLTPPAVPASALARDLTVLLDASGSMGGDPLVLAKRVVAGLLESLEAGDRFELIAFASAPRRLARGPLKATAENLQKALRSLEALEAGGGTEMATALVEALAPLRKGSQRQVVLVTDGYIGFEAGVVGEIMRRLPERARVHTVGVGAAPNRALTRAVARAGRGVEVFASDEPSAAEASRRLCRATVRPVLTELSVGGDGLRGLAPERPRDVLGGQPLVLALELNSEGGPVEVSGRQAGTAEAWIWRIVVPATHAVAPGEEGASARVSAMAATTLPLGALYGREVIADLELEAATPTRDGADLDARIERAGLRHRITSRMTSLVAVAEEPSVDPKLPRRRERLPVEVPAGITAEGSGLIAGGPARLMGAGAMGMLVMTSRLQAAKPLESFLLRRGSKIDAEMLALTGAAQAAWVPPSEVRIADGRMLRVAPDGFTVEFETPFDGFMIPEGEVNVWLDGASWLVARVVSAENTPLGPHAAGLVVRLALSIDGHADWMQARSVDLRWLSRPEGKPGDRAQRQIILTVALPQEATRAR
jgi:Ca-activated chloride channel family protein